MKDKRITMKDVAKEAGVSTATVSYVLNYSDTERISHETRLRVFEAANKLNYVPNMAAKALSEKKSYLVGMIINKRARSKKSKIYQYYDLADEIRVILHALGYDMFLISAEEIEEGVSIGIRRTLDAVFIVDLEESLFKKIANKFFVPAIFIDGYVADPLFCKVLVDSKELLDKAQEILGEEFYVVLEDYFNDYLLEYIRKRVKQENIFVNKSGSNLPEFLQSHQQKKGLIIGEILGVQVENYVDNRNICVVVHSEKDIMLLPDTKIIVVSNKEKARKAVEVMQKLLCIDGNNSRLDMPSGSNYIKIN